MYESEHEDFSFVGLIRFNELIPNIVAHILTMVVSGHYIKKHFFESDEKNYIWKIFHEY